MAEIDITRFSNHIDADVVQRFIKFIRVDQNTNSWIWVGGITGRGYGGFWYKGKTVSAHRFSYELVNGPISKDLFVCHKYEELGRHNVNPDHLFLGDGTENMQDASTKGRLPYGVKNVNAKLLERQVIEIRNSTLTYQALSLKYGVSKAKISHIKRNQSWQKLGNVQPVSIHSLRNKTGYRGVRINDHPKMKTLTYRAAITITTNGIKNVIDLGSYKDPIEAAKAFDKAAIKYRGEKAKTNFSYDL